MKVKIFAFYHWLQKFTDRDGFPWLIGFIAFLDNFFVVFPTDALLVSSALLHPNRKKQYILIVALGSSLGAYLIAKFVNLHGMSFVYEHFPNLESSRVWLQSAEYFKTWGPLSVLFFSASPIMSQPAVILAALPGHAPWKLFVFALIGRIIKYVLFVYLASKAPERFQKWTKE